MQGSEPCILLVDRLHKLADDEGHALYSLDLFLCSHELSLQTPGKYVNTVLMQMFDTWRFVPLLVFNIFFL